MTRPVLLLALACALPGCAAGMHKPQAAEEPHQGEVSRYERRMRQFEQELDSSLQASGQPDCARACELGGIICRLSGRICDIAGRHPGDTGLQARCADANRRCERSREKLARRCECEGLDI